MDMYNLILGDTSKLEYVSIFREFDLGGTILSLDIKYNSVNKGLYMDVYDLDGIILAYNIKLVPNVYFLSNLTGQLGRDLKLIILSANIENDYSDVTLENIGKEMILYYVTTV